jgi:hypothetical protein
MKSIKVQDAMFSLVVNNPEVAVITAALDMLYNKDKEYIRELGLANHVVWDLLNGFRLIHRDRHD